MVENKIWWWEGSLLGGIFPGGGMSKFLATFPSKENLVTEFLNIFSFADNWNNFNSIDFGSCLIMDGG